ncbi:MAG: transporter substrate-binding protein [Paenibacillus sp.]|jgi:ABC-type glycerol-3-phosphate transport system substrate-binding protein|nr:transporter substrate-binding protein [Paenibacillus sp.]
MKNPRNGWMRKIYTGLLVVPILLSACTKSETTEMKENETDSTGPVKLTIMGLTYNKGPIPDDNIIIKELESKLNLDLDIQWVPFSQIGERLNVAMASGDVPDLINMPPNEYVKWKEEGAFLEVSQYVKDAPNLNSKINKDKWEFFDKGGKFYGFPMTDPYHKEDLLIRKDWLDAAGLKIPVTMDEMSQTLKKLVDSDPDKNGTKDTYGFTVDLVSQNDKYVSTGIREAWIFGAFGVANSWKNNNGQLTPAFLQPEMKPFLQWMKQQYDNGVLYQDFANAPGTQKVNDYRAGKSALAMVNQRLKLSSVDPGLKQVQSQAETLFIDSPKGPDGKTGYRIEKPILTMFAIPASLKNQSKIKAAVKLLDYMASDEGYELIKYGIKEKHYSIDSSGAWKELPLAIDDRIGDLAIFFFHPDDQYLNIFKTVPAEESKTVRTLIDKALKEPLVNPAWGIESEAETQYGIELNAIVRDTYAKIITGKEPVEYLEKQQNAWKANGGNEVIKEINELYQKRGK